MKLNIFLDSYVILKVKVQEAFNKTSQRPLSAVFDNIIQEKITWDWELNLLKFIHFYNCSRKHATTEEIPKHVMDNYNNKSLMEKVPITDWEISEEIPWEKWVEWGWCCPNHKLDIKN